MTQLVVTPDLEDALIGWLPSRLAALELEAYVATTTPNPLPARSVRLFRSGGDRRNIATSRPLIVVECRANRETDAFRLASRVDGLLRSLDGETVGGIFIRSIDGGEPQNLPDPTGPQARYTALYQFGIKTQVLDVA